jgi:hypothetical protein
LSALHGAIFPRTAKLFSANYGKPLKEFPVKVPVVPVIVGISYDSTRSNNLFIQTIAKSVGIYCVGILYDSAQQQVNWLGAVRLSEKLTIPIFEPKNFGMRSMCCKATENPDNLSKIFTKSLLRCEDDARFQPIVFVKEFCDHQASSVPFNHMRHTELLA